MKYVIIPLLRSLHCLAMLFIFFIGIILISLYKIIWQGSFKKAKNFVVYEFTQPDFWEYETEKYKYRTFVDYIIMRSIAKKKTGNTPGWGGGL